MKTETAERAVSAVLANTPSGCRFCALAIILLTALALAGCAVDQEKLERTRADLETLCEDPITRAGKALCDRYTRDQVPPAPAPVE